MAEVPRKSHKKHKSKDKDPIDPTSKVERKKKKRKLDEIDGAGAGDNNSSITLPSSAPTSTVQAATMTATSTRTVKSADVSTPYALTTAARYLPISPAYSATPHVGIQRDHLDPLVLKYDAALSGVVLLHRNLRFESSAAEIRGESPFAFAWCRVEFVLFQPVVGMVLEGWVNDVSPSHVGMLFGNVFSVAVKAAGIPDGWRWVPAAATSTGEGDEEGGDEDEEKGKGKKGTELIEGLTSAMGRWLDLDGMEVEGLQKFVVTAVKVEGGLLSLEGSFKNEDLPEEEDRSKNQQQQGSSTVDMAVRETTEIHGKVSSDDEEAARRRRKEKKEKKKRKRAE
ncbi:DNA-directed RNA polymerase I subunit RPA43 [Drechslerella dactyloides]|uniref:DNA-directed RNA polymerase subunit n=1 Tax=Drechslerella dactyloides TaxID=74499 RepID=A0AAD6NNI1_DREDA|nr:DNA-directed RNA polymerase I subunit RPA43 [Drechslerella dactyloides]